MTRQTIAVVGAGFSGSLLAINLLRVCDETKVVLIERAAAAGRGVAYAEAAPEQRMAEQRMAEPLLNVRAGGMSAYPDAPRHFVEWLAAQEGAPVDDAGFVSRRRYGDYLQAQLADLVKSPRAAGRLVLTPDEAVGAGRRSDGGWSIELALGRRIEADALVLAVGNLPPRRPTVTGWESLGEACYIADPWAKDALDRAAQGGAVLLLGSGLTMVDVALGLAGRGARSLFVLSRHGLIPRTHAAAPPDLEPEPPPEGRLSARLKAFRARAEAIGWRTAMDRLRPHTTALWTAAEPAERRRFLRHLRPWWDVHRHRLAPAVSTAFEALRSDGVLQTAAGRLMEVAPEGDGVRAVWRPRGERAPRSLVVDRIVNCTGPLSDIAAAADPLLRALHAQGCVRGDPLGLGLDVAPDLSLRDGTGAAQDDLYALGPMTRGAFWESTAAPDIRVQAATLARRLAGRVAR